MAFGGCLIKASNAKSLGNLAEADLEKLQDELGTIKTELIQRYRDGYLEGADMLSAFLKHANDASELISRIVLHETEPKRKVSP